MGETDAAGIQSAARLASSVDHVLLVIGEDFDLSGEARSRSDISLPESQSALADAIFATGKPVTVLLVTGRPLAIPDVAEKADAILNTWMLGIEAGPAIADIVFGRASPAGRLPVDFPRATGQSPIVYSELPSGRPADPDLSKDTNRFIDLPITPLYPFGHGLSYSEFTYGAATLSKTAISANESAEISVQVTNSGTREAEEVVQLYMHDPVASVSRPKLELRGFKRITLKPGQSQTVTFAFSPLQAAIYREDGVWDVEEGVLEFHIGSSSADLHTSAELTITSAVSSRVPASAIMTEVTTQ